MGDGKQTGYAVYGCWINGLIIIVALYFLGALMLYLADRGALQKARLLSVLSNARQIQIGVQSAAEDYAITNSGIGWPADSGIKSAHEYVQRLVKENVFKIGDSKIFTVPGVKPAISVETISENNIGFRIANVSASDPPETIFVVTPNFVDNTPYPFVDIRPWWHRYFVRVPRQAGFIVVRKNGEAKYFTKPPSEVPQEEIGLLPPREPKFLEP